ncbi:ABC transporter substrate-binding protein [Limnohabitans sp. Rim8]|jgi:ABC-type branched-subunit amino acid transport system substrate-binding protein|uniref:ABC transporter substrate-binding protein n=1 Tax=Limnohabitans sp. Rim8 TaxID=1100718 RepID=UPI0025D2DFCA|nr:ABC transporter substrate-binding protein [Limnohabitans sp. Rim8]
MNRKLKLLSLVAGIALILPLTSTLAAGKYDPGANDKEVKVGNMVPYSGPASAYGNIGKAISAYFKAINEAGGINGRQINFISLDDGYSPPKTVEMTRKLVEQERVLFIAAPLGTPPNSAIHKYMNQKKVPQIFVNTGAYKWGDPKNFPWTMGLQPDYQTESKIYADHILKTNPNAKIAILYQNDDYGKDYLKGMEDGLGDKKGMIVAKASYETTDPTVSNQMVSLKSSGADTFFNITTPKWAAQAIKIAAELGWKPTHYLNSVSSSVGSVMLPAGAENGIGVISSNYFKDPADPVWAKDKGFLEYKAWLEKNMPGANITDGFYVSGYVHAAAIAQVIRQAGDELTRANIMKQAANLKNVENGMLLPGVKLNTSPTDFYPIENKQLMKWNGKSWELFGELLGPK